MKNRFQCKALNNHKKTKTIVLTQVAQNLQRTTYNLQLPQQSTSSTSSKPKSDNSNPTGTTV